MTKSKIRVLLATFVFFSFNLSFADVPNLSGLNLSQVDNVFETFATTLAFRPLEPASPYGKFFGLSLGVIGSTTSASRISGSIPGVNINSIPAGDIFIGLSFPFGLGLELGFIPNINRGGIRLMQKGSSLRWSPTALLSDRPACDFAIRLLRASASLGYVQTISGVKDTISFDTTMSGFNLELSKRFLYLFEPFISFGFMHQDSTLANTGSVTLFNNTITLSNTYSKQSSSAVFNVGMQLHFLILAVTGEFERMFGTNTMALKVSLRI